MFFVGLELSKVSLDAVALDLETGKVLTQANVPHATPEDPTSWLISTDAALRELLLKLESTDTAARRKIAGMGVTGFSAGTVFLDANNAILAPGLPEDASELEDSAGELMLAFGGGPGLVEMGCNRIRPDDTAAQLQWIKKNRPEIFANIASILAPHDFVNFWLTGTLCTEYSEASASGLFDFAARDWRAEICAHLAPDLQERLPSVSSSVQPHGALRHELSELWGLESQLIISAGCGLTMARAIGSGAVNSGTVVLNFDDSLELAGISPHPPLDPRGEITGLCDAHDQWLPTMRIANGLSLLKSVATHYQLSLPQAFENASQVAPGADGLSFLPYLKKEASPQLKDASGMLHGMKPENFTIPHICRAALEGIAQSCAYGLSRLEELGFEATEICLTGAGAGEPLLRQILADACGLPTVSITTPTPPALGVAMQAAVTFFQQNGETLSHGELAEYLITRDEETRCQPNPAAQDLYGHNLSHRQYLAEILQDAGFL